MGYATIATALDQGNQVIVDYLGHNDLADGMPSTNAEGWSFAHFARIYRVSDNDITIVNSIVTTDESSVVSSRSDFSQAWENPEERAWLGRENPDLVEHVDYWMMIISKP
jgi:hypothetical protein